MILAALDLTAQRWHVVELGVAILQPALVLSLCLGFVLASAHLITMLGTRWGDRGTSSKALFFSLAVHVSFACGIIALIPEYRQRIFFAASRDAEHFAKVIPQPEGPAAAASSGRGTAQPIWDRVPTKSLSSTARTAIDVDRPAAEAAPDRMESAQASIAPQQAMSVPLPDAVEPIVKPMPLEAPMAARPADANPLATEEIQAEARSDAKPRSTPFRPSPTFADAPAAEMQRPDSAAASRPQADISGVDSLASLDTPGRNQLPQATPTPNLSEAAPTGGRMSPAPPTLLETSENGIAIPQPGPASNRPGVSSSIARLGTGMGPGRGMTESGAPERFRPSESGAGGAAEPGTGTGRNVEGNLSRIDGLPQLTPSLPTMLRDPLAPVSPGSGKTPAAYQLRAKEQRDRAVVEFGGSDATEAAVDLSLNYLTSVQRPEGYWDAQAHGAGRVRIDSEGVDRHNVGRESDVGVTALAVLAYLGKMNTTEEGPHSQAVTKALRWLAEGQRADGFLGRNASEYSAMYCHGIATFALAEAYALSQDKVANAWLRGPLSNAVKYTLSCQLQDGGWRYLRGQPDGDMSMFGWQLMSLRSAEAAGVEVPSDAKAKMIQFLQNRSTGRSGGLAAYRAGEQVTPVMTAEALFCKQMLGMRRTNPSSEEAVTYLQQALPNREKYNLYYWYYGTLAMFQHGGEPWGSWNGSMRDLLVSEQIKTGRNAGSWDPIDRWGGSGGRIYSTAMATMCLEVYYRYLPLYRGVATEAPRRGPAPVE